MITVHKLRSGAIRLHVPQDDVWRIKEHLKKVRQYEAYKLEPKVWLVAPTNKDAIAFVVDYVKAAASVHPRTMKGACWLFKVPNTKPGHKFLKFFRKIMNLEGWELRIRYRSPKPGTKKGRYDLSAENSEILSVYAFRRRERKP